MVRQKAGHHHQVVVSVLLERRGTFKQRRLLSALEELSVKSAGFCASQVFLHLGYVSRAMEHVHPSVVIEHERAVVQIRTAAEKPPRTFGSVCGIHEAADVVDDEPCIELTLVVDDRRRPLSGAVSSLSVLGLERILRRIDSVEDIGHYLPVHHVLGTHHRRARHEMHRRRDHVDVVSRAAHARIGTVRKDDRVAERRAFRCLSLRGVRPLPEQLCESRRAAFLLSAESQLELPRLKVLLYLEENARVPCERGHVAKPFNRADIRAPPF